MNPFDDALEAELRKIGQAELQNAPRRHPRQTDACPSLPQLTREHYTGMSGELSAHLKTCEFCRWQVERLTELDRQDQEAATREMTRVVLFFTLVARQMVARFRQAQRFDSQVVELPVVRLEFEGDARLHADLTLDRNGRHWLDVKSDDLPAGTLLRVRVEGGDGPAWSRFAMLRSGFRARPIARLCVEEALGEADRRVAIDVFPNAAGLTVDDTAALKESFATARQDDPDAVPAWKEWAAGQSGQPGLPDAVRDTLREIADAPPLDPPGTGRMATAVAGPVELRSGVLPRSA